MHQPVLLAVAAGESHPLIDIDLTVLIQLGLFAIMALVAARWLFAPYLKMRADRADGIEGAREEAARMDAEAAARLADYEQKLATARSRAFDEQRKIRLEAAEHQREVTDKARAEAQAALDAARAELTAQTEAARADLLPRADALAADIASRLLDRKVA